MINEPTEERAVLYVLDLLNEQENLEFEAALKESAELRRYVRELSSGLHEPLKSLKGGADPMLLPGILSRLEGETEDSRSGLREVESSRNPRIPWSYIWASAASLLLVLNLILLFLLNEPPPDATNALLETDGGIKKSQSNSVTSRSGDSEPSNRTELEARLVRLQDKLEDARANMAAVEAERLELSAENEEIRQFNTEWKREYARLAVRFLPFFEPNDGMSRFTVIEMVDAEAFEKELPRRGFADLAGRFLTGEGNIAGINPGDFVGPVVEGAGASAATLDSSGSLLTPVAGTKPLSPGAETFGEDEASTTISDSRPTGFTVWRDDEQKGFLDLYNLPDPPEGQAAFLWVRSSEMEPYIPVGDIPSLENGTGSLFYSVDEPNFTPADILITAEPDGDVGSAPSGTVLLRGP